MHAYKKIRKTNRHQYFILICIVLFITFTPNSNSKNLESNNTIEKTIILNSHINHFDSLPLGSPGPIIGLILEKWAEKTDQYYRQPFYEIDFELKRQLLSNRSHNFSILIVDIYGNADFSTIQEAITDSQPGDAILVYSGKYKENIKIDKPLYLIGISKFFSNESPAEKPMIFPNDLLSNNETLIKIKAKNVVLSGFHIQGKREYISISKSANSTVIFENDFTLHNNSIGINISSSNCSLIRNNFHDTHNGNIAVLAEKSNNLEIKNNSFYDNNFCIILNNSNKTLIHQNTFKRSSNAILFAHGIILDTTFSLNNFIENDNDIIFSNNNEVHNLKFSNKSKGNYWLEYNGYDIDNDGIGDVPFQTYEIFDPQPLMSPFNNTPPNPADINPDEQGILCCKTNENIPFFVEINDEDSNNILMGRFVFASEVKNWEGPYTSSEIIHSYNTLNASGKYLVSVYNIHFLTKDEYGLSSISEPYEVHIYDLQVINNPLIKRLLDNLIPTYFLSGWH